MRAKLLGLMLVLAGLAAGCATPQETGEPTDDPFTNETTTGEDNGTAPPLDGTGAEQGVPLAALNETHVASDETFQQGWDLDPEMDRITFIGSLINEGNDTAHVIMMLSAPGDVHASQPVQLAPNGAGAVELTVTDQGIEGSPAAVPGEESVGFGVVLRVDTDQPLQMSGSFYGVDTGAG